VDVAMVGMVANQYPEFVSPKVKILKVKILKIKIPKVKITNANFPSAVRLKIPKIEMHYFGLPKNSKKWPKLFENFKSRCLQYGGKVGSCDE